MYFSWHGMYQKNQATQAEKNNNATKSVNIGQWQIEACVCKDDVDSCPLTKRQAQHFFAQNCTLKLGWHLFNRDTFNNSLFCNVGHLYQHLSRRYWGQMLQTHTLPSCSKIYCLLPQNINYGVPAATKLNLCCLNDLFWALTLAAAHSLAQPGVSQPRQIRSDASMTSQHKALLVRWSLQYVLYKTGFRSPTAP